MSIEILEQALDKMGVDHMPIAITLDGRNRKTIREVLTRMGVAQRGEEGELPILWQVVHLSEFDGELYLTHFKHLYILDGKGASTRYTDVDQERLKFIASRLNEWGLITLDRKIEAQGAIAKVKCIKYNDKGNYILNQKYREKARSEAK